MKKLLLFIFAIVLIALTACTQVKLTELRITGTSNHTVFVGQSVNLFESVNVISNTGDAYLNELTITSEDCQITDNIITSDVVYVCNITYYIEVKDVSDEKNITVSFVEENENIELIEEYNNLRIYQIYVSAYQDGILGGYDVGYGPSNHNGDLQGIINALDYIENLGVNAIWLTPIFESKENINHSEYEIRGRSTGYFADDYYNIDPNFGTNELFRTLVDEVHERGMYILLDGVFGHHGSYPIDGVVDGRSQWYGHETVYPESLDFFIDVATYWIEEYEIDGWRMDQAYQLYQDDYNYFRDIRSAVEQLCLERKENGETWGILGYMVAEVWDNPENIQKYGYNQTAFRSAFDFPTQYMLIQALTNQGNITAILQELDVTLNYDYSDFAQPNLFISNHDMIRLADLFQISGLEYQSFERHKLAFSFLAAYTGPITIYYGDEYADDFSGLTYGVYELDSYPYIAQDNVGRTNGKISGFTANQEVLINYVRDLMTMRDTYDSLWNGDRENVYINNNIYADLKTSENNQILYIFNISEQNQEITISSESFNGSQIRNLFTGEIIPITGNQVTINTTSLEAMYFLIEN
jgi:glycosidase